MPRLGVAIPFTAVPPTAFPYLKHRSSPLYFHFVTIGAAREGLYAVGVSHVVSETGLDVPLDISTTYGQYHGSEAPLIQTRASSCRKSILY